MLYTDWVFLEMRFVCAKDEDENEFPLPTLVVNEESKKEIKKHGKKGAQ